MSTAIDAPKAATGGRRVDPGDGAKAVGPGFGIDQAGPGLRVLGGERRSWELRSEATWVRTEQVQAREGTIDTFETMKEDALAHGSVVVTPRRPGAAAGSLDPRA